MIKFSDLQSKQKKICIVGLGYVGLPLAVRMAKEFLVVGYDIDADRIARLRKHDDRTGEVSQQELEQSDVQFTFDETTIGDCHLIIVTVPTPIDQNNRPDLNPLRNACKTIGKNLTRGAIVVFESTVYPGATEEECVPVLEHESNLSWKDGFFVVTRNCVLTAGWLQPSTWKS